MRSDKALAHDDRRRHRWRSESCAQTKSQSGMAVSIQSHPALALKKSFVRGKSSRYLLLAEGVDVMRYLPPFDILKSYVKIETVRGELMVKCSYEEFVQVVRRVIADVEVDEDWYLQQYPDIADAIDKGLVESAKSHFVNDGFFEGRLPFQVDVDEDFYLRENPGVAEYVKKGLLNSGQQHFDENGYKEGRLPFEV
jgi:hypothetical protein